MLTEKVALAQGKDAQQPVVPISGHPFKEIYIYIYSQNFLCAREADKNFRFVII